MSLLECDLFIYLCDLSASVSGSQSLQPLALGESLKRRPTGIIILL